MTTATSSEPVRKPGGFSPKPAPRTQGARLQGTPTPSPPPNTPKARPVVGAK